MTKSNPPPAVQKFNEEVYILLKANTAQARSLFAYIQRSLWQYRLDKRITVTDVFIEAYIRGVKYLLSSGGETIKKPSAWMRITILNVIREKSRDSKRLVSLDWDLVSETEEAGTSETDYSECFVAIMQAFNQLSHDERKIIQLRYFENKSWQAVREKLGESELTLAALRKRGQRTLDKLRQEYHKIRPSHLEGSK